MMEFLRTWVQDIVVLLVLSLVVDIALPSGSVKRYVDYALGLMLLLLLLSPVTNFIDNEMSVSALLANAEIESGRRLKVLEPLSPQSTWLTYKMILEDRIVQVMEESTDVLRAEAAVTLEQTQGSTNFGKPTVLALKVQVRPNILAGSTVEEQIFADLRERLAKVSGIEQARVTIEFTR